MFTYTFLTFFRFLSKKLCICRLLQIPCICRLPIPTFKAPSTGDIFESSQTSGVAINSQHVRGVGYFCGRIPSWMFDKILNTTLPNIIARRRSGEKFYTTGVTQENLGLPLPNTKTTRQNLGLIPHPHFLNTNISRNVWGHSPCLRTFPGMLDDISRNVLCISWDQHFPHSLRYPHSVPRLLDTTLKFEAWIHFMLSVL